MYSACRSNRLHLLHHYMDLLHDDGLVLGHKSFHNDPANEVSHGTDAEDDEIAGRFTLEAHKGHLTLVGVCEEHARTFVNEERADTASHAAKADDSGYCAFREHIAHYGVDIC